MQQQKQPDAKCSLNIIENYPAVKEWSIACYSDYTDNNYQAVFITEKVNWKWHVHINAQRKP